MEPYSPKELNLLAKAAMQKNPNDKDLALIPQLIAKMDERGYMSMSDAYDIIVTNNLSAAQNQYRNWRISITRLFDNEGQVVIPTVNIEYAAPMAQRYFWFSKQNTPAPVLLNYPTVSDKNPPEEAKTIVPLAHSFNVTAVAISQSGKWTCSGDRAGYVLLREGGTGKVRLLQKQFWSEVTAITFSSDERLVACLFRYGKGLIVYDVQTTAVIHQFPEGQVNEPISVSFLPGDEWIMLTENKVGVMLINTRDWTSKVVMPRADHNTGDALVSASSADGRWLAMSDEINNISLYDHEQDEHHTISQASPVGVTGLHFLVNHGKLQLYVITKIGAVMMANVTEVALKWIYSLPPKARPDKTAVSPDGQLMVAGSGVGNVLCELATGKVIKQWSTTDQANHFRFNPDGMTFCMCGAVGSLPVYNSSDGSLKMQLGTDGFYGKNDIAYSADGKQLIAGTGMGGVFHYNLAKGGALTKWSPNYYNRPGVLISPDLKHVVFNSRDPFKELEIVCDGITGAVKTDIRNLDADPNRAIVLPDNDTVLFIGASHSFVNRYSLSDGSVEKNLLPKLTNAHDGVFAKSGNLLLATGFQGEQVTLWSLQSKEQLQSWKLKVSSVAFSPDETSILILLKDYSVKVFDVEGKPLLNANDAENQVVAHRFSSDGKTLMIVSQSGGVFTYDLENGGKLMRQLSVVAGNRPKAHISQDLLRILMIPQGGEFWLYNAQTGVQVKSFANPISYAAPSMVFANQKALFAYSNPRVTSGTKVIDMNTGNLITEIAGENYQMAFAPDDSHLLLGNNWGAVQYYDLANGGLKWEVYTLTDIGAASFDSEGKLTAYSKTAPMHLQWQLADGSTAPFTQYSPGVEPLGF